jgi:hypothetical protein
MAKLAKMTELTTDAAQKETPLDKTTRIVKRINEAEAEVRQTKTARLRIARLDCEAGTQGSAPTGNSGNS